MEIQKKVAITMNCLNYLMNASPMSGPSLATCFLCQRPRIPEHPDSGVLFLWLNLIPMIFLIKTKEAP